MREEIVDLVKATMTRRIYGHDLWDNDYKRCLLNCLPPLIDAVERCPSFASGQVAIAAASLRHGVVLHCDRLPETSSGDLAAKKVADAIDETQYDDGCKTSVIDHIFDYLGDRGVEDIGRWTAECIEDGFTPVVVALMGDDEETGMVSVVEVSCKMTDAEAEAYQIGLDALFSREANGKTHPKTLARRRKLYQIISAAPPMGSRQVFYQAETKSIVPKAEKFARLVNADLCRMRESGIIPYEWVSDETRWVIRPQTYVDVKDALDCASAGYRKSLWQDADCQVQIWLEKIGLASTISHITSKYDVALMPARGYSSMTYLYNAAKTIEAFDVPIYIYHFGDFDPSGVDAGRNIEKDLREHAPDAEIYFERVAVTEDQIERWNLPTRPTKKKDNRGDTFVSEVSVELDAMPPEKLRGLVEMVIRRHITDKRYRDLMRQEKAERKQIADFVAGKRR